MTSKLTKRQETPEPTHLAFESTKDGGLDMRLSDGAKADSPENCQRYIDTLKLTTGTDDPELGIRILKKVARGSGNQSEVERLNNAASMLAALKPQDETEAVLLGQFLNLQDAGNTFLRRASLQDGFYHLERYSMLATKLFNTANQTMQTLLKYRSRGQQVMQVVHVHNDGGQAIVAQNLSKTDGRGHRENQEIEPVG